MPTSLYNEPAFLDTLRDLCKNSEYFTTHSKRFSLTMKHLARLIDPDTTTILSVGGFQSEGKLLESAFSQISYQQVNGIDFDARTDILPYDTDSFDIVICWETIEHLWACSKDGILIADGIVHCWQEMGRVLKSDGIFHLTTTNRFCPRTFSGFRPMHSPQIYGGSLQFGEKNLGHIREFSGAEIVEISRHTNVFTNCTVTSHSCYLVMGPATSKYAEWSKKLSDYLQRPLKQEEMYDTIFFVAKQV